MRLKIRRQSLKKDDASPAFHVDLSPLRESPAYRALLLGQVVSLVGTQMRYVAVAWQVYSITNSSVAVGLIGLAEVIPMFLLTVHAGAWADSRDRRMIMAISQMAAMVTSVLLFLVTLSGSPSLWVIYGLVFLGSAMDALDRPARTAIIPSLVGIDKIPSALALRQITFQVSQVAGPLFGGIAIASFSIATVYLIDVLTFIASLVSLFPVPRSIPEGGGRRVRGLVSEGFAASIGRPLIRSVFAVDLVAMIFGMPRAVFPALADSFGIGANGVGLIYAAPSAGALLGAVFSGWVTRITHYGVAIFTVVAVWGASIALAGVLGTSLVVLLMFLVVAGAADVLSAVFRGTLVQEATPDHLRGRVTAINTLVVAGGPRVGDVEAGFAAALLGARGSIVSGGIICLLGVGLIAAKAPELRNYVRSRHPKGDGAGDDSE